MITKLNTCLLVVAFLSALVLISMRSQTRGYFDQAENQRRLIINLEEEYRLMQLEQAKLINISNIKEKARALGMRLQDPTNKQALKSE